MQRFRRELDAKRRVSALIQAIIQLTEESGQALLESSGELKKPNYVGLE
jgi:hypothetical protein